MSDNEDRVAAAKADAAAKALAKGIGERIEKMRGVRTMSGNNLSQAAGLRAKGHARLIERGESGIPKGETLIRLAGEFTCNIHWLLTGDGHPSLVVDEKSKLPRSPLIPALPPRPSKRRKRRATDRPADEKLAHESAKDAGSRDRGAGRRRRSV